jgi:hypothetical protein
MSTRIIDAHVHCGIQDRTMPQSFQDYLRQVRSTRIEAAVMFPPVGEVYDRTDPWFKDTPQWRQRRKKANDYLLHLSAESFPVIPYLFIWNDFAVECLQPGHRGIKWHRHPDEPVYDYDDPRCASAIREIARRNLPVVLEEEFANTLFFVRDLAPMVRVIIPHLGELNGGYSRLKRAGVWDQELVFADTALASPEVIADYVHCFGADKLLFGSDFPFGNPGRELEKLEAIPLDPGQREKIQGLNLEHLLSEVKPEVS